MTQYIGQITVILEADSPELASETLRFLAKQLDDTRSDVVFADHNGDVEDYEKIERECEESLTTQAKHPLLTVLLASLEKCAVLLADYEEHPGEEGIAYREAIAAIDEAEAAGIIPARGEVETDESEA
jgi:PHD/YefM family antitoxin component YafN of YafNO toxin-antitoxin module